MFSYAKIAFHFGDSCEILEIPYHDDIKTMEHNEVKKESLTI